MKNEVELNLSDDFIASLKRATGKRTAKAAINAALQSVAASAPAVKRGVRRNNPESLAAVRQRHGTLPANEEPQQPDRLISMRAVKALRRKHGLDVDWTQGEGFLSGEGYTSAELLGPL